jgi:eukaryotic-like serine/threonine-protein kinase
MLTGHPPFNGDSAVEIALRHVQAPVPPLPSGTPRSLDRVVTRALAKDPADRYQSAAEMASALARARRGDAHAGAPPVNGSRTGSNGNGSTWVAPQYSPRRNVNPAARRRSIAIFVLVLGLLAAMAVAAKVLTGPATVVLPKLRAHGEGRVDAVLKPLHLEASFAHAYDDHAPPGAVMSQSPAAGTRVKEGSTVQVVLSRGPRPISVPSLTGASSGAAAARLKRIDLRARVSYVPAPGTAPGIVTGQSPSTGRQLHSGQTVSLLVAETPSWRSVTTFSGAQSVPFRIRGTQWRVVYTMSYQGTCDFVFWCNGPSAQVLGAGSTNVSFSLNDGGQQTRVFKTGPGEYQIAIKPGWDSARWSIEVEDWF